MYIGRIIWGTWGGTQLDNECNVAIIMEYAHLVVDDVEKMMSLMSKWQ
jgi:hypothetical protein